ncbi:hypothetical protein A5695_22555 [Mycobacterium sp. E1747]|nr:hypothetical protein A5695_22555 [Mycobacterium sp. E1747]
MVPAARVVLADRADRADRKADRVGQVAPVDLKAGLAGLAGQVAPAIRAVPMVPAGPVARAGPTTQAAPAARAGPTTQADRKADRVGLAAPVDPVARGTEIPSAATSMGPHGATGRGPGDPVRRRDPRGTGRSPRPVRTGDTARSITGAMRRLPCGIPASISGVSGSSESGFRCKQQ